MPEMTVSGMYYSLDFWQVVKCLYCFRQSQAAN